MVRSTLQPVLRFAGINKSYLMGARHLHVLKHIDLTVHAGEYLAVMGPSGSGKSTLLNIAGLLDVPDSGEYELNGESVGQLADHRLARCRNAQIGFIFQSFNLFPQLDITGNIEVPMMYAGVGRRARRRRAAELAERVGLADRASHRPRELSGGQMQRTAIARALANRPPLILADEPTGNLDESTGDEILDLFAELVADGQTVMMVTHNPEYRKRVQRVLEMRDGEFIS
jgi:putative ABC transport system ATP-binding protein